LAKCGPCTALERDLLAKMHSFMMMFIFPQERSTHEALRGSIVSGSPDSLLITCIRVSRFSLAEYNHADPESVYCDVGSAAGLAWLSAYVARSRDPAFSNT